ncbi:MAG: aminotransferase class V-fold PLP-dependent enzyme [Acidobacteria bacterium]|nr:aminotransferase class V-fold PLP-dependent enzyme [Acidobacteriota bacterium]
MIYFNTGWASLLAPHVLETMESVFRTESELGPASLAGLRNAEEWEERCRASLARLMKCNHEELILTHGSRDGIEHVLVNMAWGVGDSIVTTSLEHSALRDGCQALAKRHGVNVRIVEIGESDRSDEAVAKVVEAIMDTGPRLVAVSHLQYGWGLYIPLEAVREATRRIGALLLVDGAQSVGHVPIRLDRDQADFYTVSGQKWLGGPSGTGALFVRRDIGNAHGQSRHETGSGWENYNSGHFLSNRPVLSGHSVALLAGLTVAVDTLCEEEVARRLDHARGLERLLRRELVESRVQVVGPHIEECNGMLAIRVEGITPGRLQSWLEETHGIVVRRVAKIDAIRLCITGQHVEEDIRRTVKALREAVEVLL